MRAEESSCAHARTYAFLQGKRLSRVMRRKGNVSGQPCRGWEKEVQMCVPASMQELNEEGRELKLAAEAVCTHALTYTFLRDARLPSPRVTSRKKGHVRGHSCRG